MTDTSILDVLTGAVAGLQAEVGPATDMPTLIVGREHLLEVCDTLRNHPELQFSLLVDVTAVDYWPAEPRFEMVYHLACLGEAYRVDGGAAAPPRRLRVKTRLSGADAVVDSVFSVYPSAVWPEREVFDLFGITFHQHPDLRRILMPEDWEGFPMRRDYPVQVKKEPQSWAPVQITAEEFAANVKRQRDLADRIAKGEAPPPSADRGARRGGAGPGGPR